MNNSQTKTDRYTKAEIDEAQFAADELVQLWKSIKRAKYDFAAALHEFGESDHHLKLGLNNVIGWISYAGIDARPAFKYRRIYRELTLMRGIPVSDYDQLSMVQTKGLMSLIDAGVDEDLYLKTLRVGVKTDRAGWRAWIDDAIKLLGSRSIDSNLDAHSKENHDDNLLQRRSPTS